LWHENMKNNKKYNNVLNLKADLKGYGGYDSNNIKPVVIYDNADTLKDQIIADNKNKSGVYRLDVPSFW